MCGAVYSGRCKCGAHWWVAPASQPSPLGYYCTRCGSDLELKSPSLYLDAAAARHGEPDFASQHRWDKIRGCRH